MATTTKTKKTATKPNLKAIVTNTTSTKAVRAGGLDLEAKLKKGTKTPRAEHNIERQTKLDGMTIREALATRIVDSRDIKYDLSKGFLEVVK